MEERNYDEEQVFGETTGREADPTDEDFREAIRGDEVGEQIDQEPDSLGDKLREGYSDLTDDSV